MPEHQYRVVEHFFQRPAGVPFVDIADVVVTADERIVVFCRGPRPVLVFDIAGKYLYGWGQLAPDYFIKPHALAVAPDGTFFTVDVAMQVVRQWTPEGRLLMTVGTPFSHSPEYSGAPFCRPAGVVVASTGNIYVADGYGNARVHCFAPDGTILFSWGERGAGPGQFDTVHSISVDSEDRLYCADRYNNRVQSFHLDGSFDREWTGLHLPNDAVLGPDGLLYVAEQRNRVSVLDRDGTVIVRFGDEDAVYEDAPVGGGLPMSPSQNPLLRGVVNREPGAGRLTLPHAIAVDPKGSVFVGEVAETLAGLDRGERCLQKFELVGGR